MACGRAGVEVDEVACGTQSQTVPVPARGEILADALQALFFKALEHPEDGVASQAGKAAHPHRDAAGREALGKDRTLRRDDLLTVEAGG